MTPPDVTMPATAPDHGSAVPIVAAEPAAWPVPRGLFAGLRKYRKICRVSLIERMTYRGDFFLGTVLRFLPGNPLGKFGKPP